LKKERDALINQFRLFSFIRKINNSDANFILIQVEEADALYVHLVSKGIIVRNRSNMPLCEGGIRITVGTEAENKQLLEALKDWEIIKSLL